MFPPPSHRRPRCGPALLAIALAAALAPAAHAAYTPHYRAELTVTGTWTESVRAPVDEADADGDGREEVAARDQELAFAIKSVMPGVTFRDGRAPSRTTSVEHAFTSLTVGRSTLTEPNGEPGGCTTHEPGTGGEAELVASGRAFVFRPAEDVIFQLVCRTEGLEWGFAMDAMRMGGALGEAPLDATFAIDRREVGAQRIVHSVAASPAQRSRERCPQEDPGHTVACSFGWTGTVTFERTDAAGPAITRPRLARDARSAGVEVVCRTACTPVLRLGAAVERFRAAAGTSRVVLALGADARRSIRRTGRARLSVRIGDHTRSFTLRAARAR